MGSMWATVGVVLAAVVVLAVVVAISLLAPVPQRSAESAARLAFWRRHSVRQRLRQRHRLVLAYLGLVIVAAIAAALVLVIWVLPPALTGGHYSHDADRMKAQSDARGNLVTVLGALGLIGGLGYTARTYRLSRAGQITDRYSKAVEQLGDEKIEVRLGGIYALERLMHDSRADQPTIMETLAAFVRQHAPLTPAPTATPVRDRRVAGYHRSSPPPVPDHPAEDVQAVLAVLSRRHPVDDERPIDLRRTNLTGADLSRAPLRRADLGGATLTNATLDLADLTHAYLGGATLTNADLSGATLTHADLGEATLTHAYLGEATLTGADLSRATLTDANLRLATLTDANLLYATLTGADLLGADLTYAVLSVGSLSEEQLARARATDEVDWIPPSVQIG